MSFKDYAPLVISAISLLLSCWSLYRTRNTVRVAIEVDSEFGEVDLQIYNDSPHAVTVIRVGTIAGDGKVTSTRYDSSCDRVRIESRDTVTLDVFAEACVYNNLIESAYGRAGWWIEVSTGHRYFTHGWLTRLIWRFHNCAVGGLARIGRDVQRQMLLEKLREAEKKFK